MKTIRDVRTWLTGLEQVVEDRVFLEQLREMQITTRNIERDLIDLFEERNKLISENVELRNEIKVLKDRLLSS